MTARELFAGASASVQANYIEDVFSTYLYSGTGASQTITNGIDLSTKGGLVWSKYRSGSATSNPYNTYHILSDTAQGITKGLITNLTDGVFTTSGLVESFNSNGFTYAGSAATNQSPNIYVNWTFRKQAKFFTICTWTGTGVARTISHDLGSTPGMIIVKRTDTTSNWQVYHRSLTSAANAIQLNLTAAQASATTVWNSTAPTSSVFSVGTDATVNASGGTYVAYLFADSNSGGFGAAGTDSVVACGSWSGIDTVNLGWEPQFVLFKRSNGVGNWNIIDNMRGFVPTPGADKILYANTSGAELSSALAGLTSTGFTTDYISAVGETYIYLAIRRGPMKTPTDATKVFATSTRSGTGAVATVTSAGFPVDMLLPSFRSGGVASRSWYDRLRGKGVLLNSSTTGAEVSDVNGLTGFDSNVGFSVGADTNQGGINYSSTYYADYMFRRAPGFFDVVCYTGTGANRTVAHNLGVAPELVIVKNRGAAFGWPVYTSSLGNTKNLLLNGTNQQSTSSYWNNASPTDTVFSLGTHVALNGSGGTYVAYLFATCPGVSKVGSYTGNGSSQTIDCGFAAGARFVLIKRTDDAGDWLVADTARGLVSGNDPLLKLNSTDAEVTTLDWIDPYSAGFEVVQESTANANVNGASYIFLAVA